MSKSALVIVAEHNRKAMESGQWGQRHFRGWTRGFNGKGENHESAIVRMVHSWAMYADAHAIRFESSIGEDYVLGPEWEAIGKGLLGLLNGETGELDCGTVDGMIRDILKANGFDGEG